MARRTSRSSTMSYRDSARITSSTGTSTTWSRTARSLSSTNSQAGSCPEEGGATGAADTEAFEFKNIYDLDVNVVPTNKPMVRADRNDSVYKSEREKFNAVAEEIKELYGKGRPIL